MERQQVGPRALFPSPNGSMMPDDEICSGLVPAQLRGKPCPYSDRGRMPTPVPIDEFSAQRLPGRGAVGDLAPPCAVQHLGRLADWEAEREARYPVELGPLRLFKCRQMFLLVVPGLKDDQAKEIS